MVTGTVVVRVAEGSVPRLAQAKGAILEAVAKCSRERGKVGKRCRSICAQTDLESPPKHRVCEPGGAGAWQVLRRRERTLELRLSALSNCLE